MQTVIASQQLCPGEGGAVAAVVNERLLSQAVEPRETGGLDVMIFSGRSPVVAAIGQSGSKCDGATVRSPVDQRRRSSVVAGFEREVGDRLGTGHALMCPSACKATLEYDQMSLRESKKAGYWT